MDATLRPYNPATRTLGKLSVIASDVASRLTNACLTDASTVMEAGDWLADGPKKIATLIRPTVTGAFNLCAERETLIWFVQSAILFDQVLVDYFVPALDDRAYKATERYADFIRPVFINTLERLEIVRFIFNEAETLVRDLMEADQRYEVSAVEADQQEGRHFKRRVDAHYGSDRERLGPHIFELTADIESSIEHETLPVLIPEFARASSLPGTRPYRTAFYIACSKMLGQPLYAHPLRSLAIAHVVGKQVSVATNLAELFERLTIAPPAPESGVLAGMARFSLGLPPVAAHALAQMAASSDPTDVLLTIRNSTRARNLRRWIADVEAAFHAGALEHSRLHKLLAGVDDLFAKWSVDLNEEIRYRTRKISVAFGSLVQVSTDSSIKDPVLWSKHSDLFFLNDIARALRIETAGRKIGKRQGKQLLREWEQRFEEMGGRLDKPR